MGKLTRNLSTPELRDWWDSVKRAAETAPRLEVTMTDPTPEEVDAMARVNSGDAVVTKADPTPEEMPTWILYVLESHGIDPQINNPNDGLAWRIYEQHRGSLRAAVEAEREACAKEADALCVWHSPIRCEMESLSIGECRGCAIAAAIRKRGEDD